MTKNDSETANEINKAFQSVFLQEDLQRLPDFAVNHNGCVIEDIDVNVKEIEDLLNELNVNKAMGPDGVHPKLLKECNKALAVPITLLIRESLDSGSVPLLWLLAAVCPIYKKGDKLDPLNYRPVSLTCVLCKICEKLIRKALVKHLEDNKIITDSQHGFRHKRSTLTNLLVYMEILTTATDQQIPVELFRLPEGV